MLSAGVKYVLTEHFTQDPLENYFGQGRAMNKRKDNPSLRDFGYADDTIRNMKAVSSIVGSIVSNQKILSQDITLVPCRKRKSNDCDELTY